MITCERERLQAEGGHHKWRGAIRGGGEPKYEGSVEERINHSWRPWRGGIRG